MKYGAFSQIEWRRVSEWAVS